MANGDFGVLGAGNAGSEKQQAQKNRFRGWVVGVKKPDSVRFRVWYLASYKKLESVIFSN